MRVAALFSGGKDSTYSIFKALEDGHELTCLISMHPISDESLLFHFPTNNLLNKISHVLGVPLVQGYCEWARKEVEITQLTRVVKQALNDYPIDGLVSGVISSKFQLNIFQEICNKFNLKLLSPLWEINSDEYFNKLLNLNFRILITRVAAMGLDSNWLGKEITYSSYLKMKALSKKYQFNMTFEGGEGETLVLDCPIYKKKILVKESRKKWDGIRGIFEISDIDLIEK